MKILFFFLSMTMNASSGDACRVQMRRQISAAGVLLGKYSYSVTVSPNVDYVFVAALVVMLHEIHRRERG